MRYERIKELQQQNSNIEYKIDLINKLLISTSCFVFNAKKTILRSMLVDDYKHLHLSLIDNNKKIYFLKTEKGEYGNEINEILVPKTI